MTATYDPTTTNGQLRLLISDTNIAEPTLTLFQDEELAAFLAMNVGVKRSAAAALTAIAGNMAMVDKKIKTQDLQTDAPAVAAELRAQAASLWADADLDDSGFVTVDFDPWAAERKFFGFEPVEFWWD